MADLPPQLKPSERLFGTPEVEEIKEKSTALQGGILDEGREVGIISTPPVIEEFAENATRVEELKTQIGETQEAIATKQKELQKVQQADQERLEKQREADRQARLEREAVGEAEEVEDPQITELKQQVETLTSEGTAVQGELDKLALAADVASQNVINSIKGMFDSREKELVTSNARATQQAETFGIRFGLQRSSPIQFAGLVSTQERAGIQAIANLNAQEAILISEAEQARTAENFSLLREKLERIDKNRDKKASELKDLQKNIQERNEEVALEEELLNAQSVIVNLQQLGIDNPADIFNVLGGNVPLQVINGALDQIIIQQDEKFGTGAVGQFQQLKALGELPQDLGFFEFNRLLALSKQDNSNETITRDDLSPFQRLGARNLSVQIFGKRAGTKPENVGLIEDLMAGGMSIDDISDQLRLEQQSTEFQGTIRDAAESIGSTMTEKNREFFFDSLDRSLTDGNNDRVRELMMKGAIDSYDTATAKIIRGNKRAVELVSEIETDLRAFEAQGGDTGIFEGTEEKVAAKIGKVGNVKLAKIANKIAIAIQRYRHDISGAAFTESEAKEYRAVFPGIDKTGELNAVKIDSLKEVLSGDVKFYVESRIGTGAYKELYGNTIFNPEGAIGEFSTGLDEEVESYLIDIGY